MLLKIGGNAEWVYHGHYCNIRSIIILSLPNYVINVLLALLVIPSCNLWTTNIIVFLFFKTTCVYLLKSSFCHVILDTGLHRGLLSSCYHTVYCCIVERNVNVVFDKRTQ